MKYAFYGTLLGEAVVLDDTGEEAGLWGPECLIPGKLLLVHGLPGLVLEEGWVRGRLWEPRPSHKMRAMEALDTFEGFDRRDPAKSLYTRNAMRVMARGHEGFESAWVYVWNGDQEGAITIEGGDWLRWTGRRDGGNEHHA